MISKLTAWLALIGGVVAVFWGLLTLFSTPEARCDGWRMRSDGICHGRGYQEQLRTASERTRLRGGVALGGGLLLASAGFLLLARVAPVVTGGAGPDTGRRSLLARQRGWHYAAIDPLAGERYPNTGLSRNAAGNDYSRVISGELDGMSFDVFNHSYSFGTGSVAIPHEDTVFLLRLRPCSAAFSVEDGTRVMPSGLQPLVLTEELRRACAKARVRDWSVVDSTLVYTETAIPDSRIARIPARLAALRSVAAAMPAIVFSGPRID